MEVRFDNLNEPQQIGNILDIIENGFLLKRAHDSSFTECSLSMSEFSN